MWCQCARQTKGGWCCCERALGEMGSPAGRAGVCPVQSRALTASAHLLAVRLPRQGFRALPSNSRIKFCYTFATIDTGESLARSTEIEPGFHRESSKKENANRLIWTFQTHTPNFTGMLSPVNKNVTKTLC